MKTFAGVGIVIALFSLMMSAVSCSKDKAADKPGVIQSSEESKKAEAFRKGVSESKETIIAKVNDAGISMFDLIGEMNTIAPQYIKPGQKKTPEIDEQVRKEALDRLIYRELAVQEAVKQGMRVPQEKIDQQIKKIRADLKSEEAFQQKLSAMGTTEAELKKQFERAFLVEMITQKEVFDKVKIDIGLIRKTYENEMALYKGPSGQMSFKEARPAIEEKLMTPRIQKREDEWVDRMKKNAKIEITMGKDVNAIQSVR
jgi:hypothetical protein